MFPFWSFQRLCFSAPETHTSAPFPNPVKLRNAPAPAPKYDTSKKLATSCHCPLTFSEPFTATENVTRGVPFPTLRKFVSFISFAMRPTTTQ